MSSDASGVSEAVWQQVLVVWSGPRMYAFDRRVYDHAEYEWVARGEPWPGATPDDLGRYSSVRCPCGNRVELPPDQYWREMTGWWLRCECRIFIHRACGQGGDDWKWKKADADGWAEGRVPSKAARLTPQWKSALWIGYKDKEHWVFDWFRVRLDFSRAALAVTCRPAEVDAAGRVLAVHCPGCQTPVPLSEEGVDRVPSYVRCDHCSTLICPVESRDDDWGEGMAEFRL